MAHEWHREGVVDEDFDDRAVRAADYQALATRRATDGLNLLDRRVEHPLALAHTCEGEELQLGIDAEQKVLGGDNEQVAIDLQVETLGRPVLELAAILVGRQLIDAQPLWQLHRQPILIDGDLLDVGAALDAHLHVGTAARRPRC